VAEEKQIDTQHHANLASEHERKAQWHKGLSEGKQPDTTGVGAQAGGFVGAIMEHKWIVIGGIAAIIAFILILRGQGGQNTSTANQAPDLSQGNFVPSNISTALDSINASISGLSNQISNQGTTTTPPINTPPTVTPPTITPPTINTPPPTIPPPQNPQPQPQYVTVTPWPTTLSTLWGISQQQGLSLARIEQLNPQIANPNLIYPGQKVRVS
jgi:LysM repeat protein